jgi:hypothetical protein
MTIARRTFIKTALAASATAALGPRLSAASASPSTGEREFYELRCYRLKAETRLKADADPALLDRYLEQALLPALDRLNVRNVGVFTELDVKKDTATATPRAGSPVWVLIPYPSLESFVTAGTALPADPAMQGTAGEYLRAPKAHPAVERIDSWLMLAFAGMPRLEVPAFSRERTPTRVFEMRDYESHSELAALNKIAMFNEGEMALMRDLGMNPVMFGQPLAGPDLPHLRYITSGADLANHLAAWSKFGPHPRWTALKNDPRYTDNMTKLTARFLTPKPYSQL